MKKIILCDIDGTIADNDHRQHFLQGKKDWDGFFSELINDEPIDSIIEMLNQEVIAGNSIVFVTGRPERYRYSTNLWLRDNLNFNYDLFMRSNGDKRNKLAVKKDIFLQYLKNMDIKFCIDNDKDLIDQWRELGIETIDVS